MNLTYTSNVRQLYPRDPIPESKCDVNQRFKTLPRGWPRRRELAGPASMARHLYPKAPNCYPYMYRDVPINTLYGHDFGEVSLVTGETAEGEVLGPYEKRLTYHFRAYPFHHFYARELRATSDEILPYPDIRNWTRYPVVTPDHPHT